MKPLFFYSLVLMVLLSVTDCQPGSEVPMPIGTPELTELVHFALREIGSEYSLFTVHEATQQVVAGIIYRIKFTALKLGLPTKRRECNVAILEVAWLNYRELEGFLCKFPNKSHLLNPEQLL